MVEMDLVKPIDQQTISGTYSTYEKKINEIIKNTNRKASLTEFLHKTIEVKSVEELTHQFIQFLSGFGLDRFVMSEMSHDGTHQQEKHHGILVNFPQDWMKHYMENHYIEHDAIYSTAMTTDRPFLWSDVKNNPNTSSEGKKILEEAREFKLCDGIGLSLHKPYGVIIGMGIASSHGGVDVTPYLMTEIYAAANQFYTVFSQLLDQKSQESFKLSKKEREVLLWLARGKTASDVASIIGISQATVKFHRNNIYTKLGVDNGKLAILKALRAGLIKPY